MDRPDCLRNAKVEVLRKIAALMAACMAFALLLGDFAKAQSDKKNNGFQGNATAPGASPKTTTASFGSWVLRCRSVKERNKTSTMCELQQFVVNARGETVLAAFIAASQLGKATGKNILGIRIPVNVRLGEPVEIVFDQGKVRFALDLKACIQNFCMAEAELAPKLLSEFGGKANRKVELSFADAASRPVNIPMSLSGFEAAFLAYRKQMQKR